MQDRINNLVEEYLPYIRINNVVFDDTPGYDHHGRACLYLLVPQKLLEGYCNIKGKSSDRPDAEEFWKESKLAEKLKKLTDEKLTLDDSSANDALMWLTGDVVGLYSGVEGDKVKLDIYEEKDVA